MKRTALLSLAALVLGLTLALPASAADSDALVGIWRASATTPFGQTSVETILRADGTFQTLTLNNNGIDTHAFRVVGRWYVVSPGWLRMHNDDWAPRVYKGVETHVPATESHAYRFLNENQVVMDEALTFTRG